MRHSLRALALVGSSLIALSACGSDDSADNVDGRAAWCATIDDVDGLLASSDADGSEFASRQAIYEQVNGEVEELIAGVETVDESARDDVTNTLEFVADLTAAIVDAPDEAAADAALVPIFESLPEGDGLPGHGWILETCGVDIND